VGKLQKAKHTGPRDSRDSEADTSAPCGWQNNPRIVLVPGLTACGHVTSCNRRDLELGSYGAQYPHRILIKREVGGSEVGRRCAALKRKGPQAEGCQAYGT
jgi:hypothetical protein